MPPDRSSAVVMFATPLGAIPLRSPRESCILRLPAASSRSWRRSARYRRLAFQGPPRIVAGVPARDRLIDVGHRDRSQGNSAVVQPIEEAIDRAAATSNRLFRPPTIGTHPRCEDRDLAGVSVSGLAGFFEQVDEAQPSHGVADESLACLGQRGLAASAPTGQRPLLGRGLDAGHVHTAAFAQIEKVDQIDLMSGDRSQRLRSNAHLFAMHEIAKALFEERIPVCLDRDSCALDRRGVYGFDRSSSGHVYPAGQPKNTKSSVLLNGKRCAPGVFAMPRYRRSALCTCLG